MTSTPVSTFQATSGAQAGHRHGKLDAVVGDGTEVQMIPVSAVSRQWRSPPKSWPLAKAVPARDSPPWALK